MVEILKGVKVISFTHFLFGPMAVQALGDLGADVVSVEPLEGSWQRSWGAQGNKKIDDQSVLFLAVDRNKHSIALNLKSEKGKEIARKLVRSADVLATNYRPGVLDKLGFGYDALKKEHPGLVYAAATGYGPEGPYVTRPGQDLLVQAMSGMAAITGTKDCGARPIGVSAIDHHGAALLALGIVSALFQRERTGKGCRVDVNLLNTAIDLQMEPFVCYLNGEKPDSVTPPRYIGGWHYEAPYGIYAASDGYLAISLTRIRTLADAISSPELQKFDDAENYTRREEIAECIAQVIKTRTTGEWTRILTEHNVWHSKVNDYDEVCRDPQVSHNQCFTTVAGATGSNITLVNHPIRYDGELPEIKIPPQPVGAQTARILSECGYSEEEIAELEKQNVIRCHRPT